MAIVGRGELQEIVPLHAARAEVAWLEGDLERCGKEAMAGLEPRNANRRSFLVRRAASPPRRAGRIDRLPDGTDDAYVLHAAGRFRGAAATWRALGCPYDEAVALADSPDEGDLRDALAILHSLARRSWPGVSPIASPRRAPGTYREARGQALARTPPDSRPWRWRSGRWFARARATARSPSSWSCRRPSTTTCPRSCEAWGSRLAAARREGDRLAAKDGETTGPI